MSFNLFKYKYTYLCQIFNTEMKIRSWLEAKDRRMIENKTVFLKVFYLEEFELDKLYIAQIEK